MQFFTILLLAVLAGMEVDLFIPSFPELQAVFHLTPFMVELTLGLNLAAHCCSCLVVGNLGDRYGRKPVIIAGLLIFTLGSIFCVWAPNYPILLCGRVLQGVGIAGPAVLFYLLVADHYPMEKQQQMMGFINGVISLAMAFSPVIGSYVNLFFDWRGNFVLLLGFGLLCLLFASFFVRKGVAKPDIAFSLREYLPVLASKKARYYIITICFMVAPYWVFIGMAPIFYMEDCGVSLREFGLYQGATAATFASGSFASGPLLRYFGQRKCFIASIGLILLFIFAAMILMLLNIHDARIVAAVLCILSVGVIVPANTLWPLSLEAVPGAKARISALVVSGRLILTAMGVQWVSYFYQGTFVSIGLLMCLSLVFSLYVCYKLSRIERLFTLSPPG